MLDDLAMTDERPPIELTDPRALRAYAHPVRGKLVGLLRRRGPLTATQAAQLLGESSGTTSFHLRQLAKYGLVEEAPGGRGREKPWQATSLMTHIPPIQATPEAAEAAQQLRISMAQRYFEQLVAWLRRSADESDEWREAAGFGDRIIWVTPAELKALDEAIDELIEPYGRRMANHDERPAGAREVTFLGFAYPMEPP
jgi:DNA-binding transcriptional ArsR family regulator